MAILSDCSTTAESSLETKAMEKRRRKKTKTNKINKNEATLSEMIVLIFRILIQIFYAYKKVKGLMGFVVWSTDLRVS